MPIISASDVSKTFRQRRRFPGITGAIRGVFTRQSTEVNAVAGVSFDIEAGEAVGYLGPNGAGKSTMIKMLCGILVPTAGEVRVLSRDPNAERMRNARDIGVVFGQRSQLWWDLPVIDSFELHRRIYRIAPDRYRANLDRFTAMLGLGGFLDRAVRQLSLGERMRAELVMALLHEPKILFLDEPTIGLDVVAKDAVRKFLRAVNRSGQVTLILTTHDLQDLEQVCPRLIMVDEGKLIYDGELRGLRASLGSKRRLKIEFESDPGAIVIDGLRALSDGGPVKHYLIERDDIPVMGLLGGIDAQSRIKDISVEEPTIEEVIRTFYQGRTRPVPS